MSGCVSVWPLKKVKYQCFRGKGSRNGTWSQISYFNSPHLLFYKFLIKCFVRFWYESLKTLWNGSKFAIFVRDYRASALQVQRGYRVHDRTKAEYILACLLDGDQPCVAGGGAGGIRRRAGAGAPRIPHLEPTIRKRSGQTHHISLTSVQRLSFKSYLLH